MTTVPRRSSTVVTIGRLMVFTGVAVFGIAGIAAFPVCPMIPVQPPLPPGCVVGGPSFLSAWDGLMVSLWAIWGYTLVFVGTLLFYFGRWTENTTIRREESS